MASYMPNTEPRAVILMGVSGSGKSTVGTSLAQRLGCPFLDADDFHPAANVEKMKHGIPLNDEDRMPWLRRLHKELEHRLGSRASVVLGCSALKESYRKILEEGLSRIDFVFLDVDQLTLTERWEKGTTTFFQRNCSIANSRPWNGRRTHHGGRESSVPVAHRETNLNAAHQEEAKPSELRLYSLVRPDMLSRCCNRSCVRFNLAAATFSSR